MRWCIEYIPENEGYWQHAYLETEEETMEAIEFLENELGAKVVSYFELDY